MANPKKRKVVSPERMPASVGTLAKSAIESFFEDEDFEKLFERKDIDEVEELDFIGSVAMLDDLEGELFDDIGDIEDFDLN